MNASRGVKRKRDPAKPRQTKAQLTPEQILPGKLHHSLQEFKRLAKRVKVNETQIIVKKLKSLRSLPDEPGTATRGSADTLQDLEAQLIALKALNLAHFATAALIQKLKRNRTLSTNETVSEFLSTVLQPFIPLDYYAVELHSAEGKIRNRLTSSKSFSGRASELVTDIQAIIDLSVAKPSRAIRAAAVDKEEENEEDDFFDESQSSDHDVDDGGWESGSVHSQNDGPSVGQFTMSTDSDSESELRSDSTLDADPPGDPGAKSKPQVKLKPEVILEEDEEDGTPGSDSDSDPSNLSSQAQTKALKTSGGAGTSTFLPSLSVGYIPGTGDSDPEDELEAMEGKAEKKNRRGQRARRAIWEKKYGRGAKHVVKQREEEAEKKKIKEERRRRREPAAKRPRWATKKTFEPPKQTDSGYGGRAAAKFGGGDGNGRGDERSPLKRSRREDKSLHPSWEAKMKMKKKESIAITPPAGKKIVF